MRSPSRGRVRIAITHEEDIGLWWRAHVELPSGLSPTRGMGWITTKNVLVNDLDTHENNGRHGFASLFLSSLEVKFHRRAIPKVIARFPQALPFWKRYLGERGSTP